MKGHPIPITDNDSTPKRFLNVFRRTTLITDVYVQENTIRLFWLLGILGFISSLTLTAALIYYPLIREGQELERYRLTLEQALREYRSFVMTEEIPGVENLPQILDQYQSELRQNGISVKAINIEKFVSNSGPEESLGYALVRLQCDHFPQLPEILQGLEVSEEWRIIIEELKLDKQEARVLLKVYFATN